MRERVFHDVMNRRNSVCLLAALIVAWPGSLRACLKIPRGAVFAAKAGGRGATREHTRQWSVTEEQRSQTALAAKTLRAAGLLAAAGVGSVVTARGGDAPTSPPWPPPKSLAAEPHGVFRRALSASLLQEIRSQRLRCEALEIVSGRFNHTESRYDFRAASSR